MKMVLPIVLLGSGFLAFYLGLVWTIPSSWLGSVLQRWLVWFSICLTDAHSPSPILGYSGIALLCFGSAAFLVIILNKILRKI